MCHEVAEEGSKTVVSTETPGAGADNPAPRKLVVKELWGAPDGCVLLGSEGGANRFCSVGI